jgi:hypothetical protein
MSLSLTTIPIVPESQTIPADESVESAGMCHCFPQRVSVIRAFGPQRQHSEVVSNGMRSAQRSHASTCIVLWKQTSVHVVVCMQSVNFKSFPRTYTLRDARCALRLTSAHGCRGQHEWDWIALTHFPPPGATRLTYEQRLRVDKRQTQVAKRPALAATIVVGGSVPVTLLGECALSRLLTLLIRI